MSDDLIPTITRAGLAACRNAQGTGLLATISAVAIGRGVPSGGGFVGYAPTGGETALKGEMARVPLLSGAPLGGVAGSDPIGFRVLAQVPALAPGSATYPVNEVGFFLDDGTLLCVWSDPVLVLAYMTAQAPLELAHDLFLSQLPVASMAITVLFPDIPDLSGVVAQLLALSARDATEYAQAIGRDFSNIFTR